MRGILASGASLFAAVWIAYYYAASMNLPLAEIQTYAFTAWITGHLILAYISRSETDPLYKLGLFSNGIMNYWAALVVPFLALFIYVPAVGTQLKATWIPIGEIAGIALIAFLAIIWQEIGKTIKYLKNNR
ncbi:MAG: cation-translocating P-type ATPase C-terminal domain-containing protein [Candidatus Altiarchaeia archaeon]